MGFFRSASQKINTHCAWVHHTPPRPSTMTIYVSQHREGLCDSVVGVCSLVWLDVGDDRIERKRGGQKTGSLTPRGPMAKAYLDLHLL